jgi:anti-sigma-K factor RskA
MSTGDSMPGHGDAAAFALGALESDEVEAFRRHMATCAACREEVEAFQQVADALPMSAAQYEVPRGLRGRVMQAIREEQASASGAPDKRRSFGSLRIALPRHALALAGGLAVAAIVVVAIVVGSGGGSGVTTIKAQVAGISGTAELRESGGHAELIVRDMSPPPPGKIYEVWLQRPGRAPSPTSRLFSVTSGGSGDVGLPSLSGIKAVLVTPEPLGGSPAPTHTPVITAQLT